MFVLVEGGHEGGWYERFDNGMSFFPLYQEEGNHLSDFGYDQGVAAAQAAYQAAMNFGIPGGTVIYFSVDFDGEDIRF